jgi:hypothetical protein
MDRCFLFVAESGHTLALNHILTVFSAHVREGNGRMAHGGDWLVSPYEGFDQPDGDRVVGHIPHRAVLTGIKHRVEVLRRNAGKHFRVGELRNGRGVSAESVGKFSLIFEQIALRIERRLTAPRRGKRDFRARIFARKTER